MATALTGHIALPRQPAWLKRPSKRRCTGDLGVSLFVPRQHLHSTAVGQVMCSTHKAQA